jgi:Ca-activated chloride channel family protein
MNFHWLHPALGLLIIPVILLSKIFIKKFHTPNPWLTVCEPKLLNAMLPNNILKSKNKFLVPWVIFWTSVIIALMGPAIDYEAAASFKSNRPTIIVLDMSEKMFLGHHKTLPIQQIKLALSAWLQDKSLGPWALVLFTEEAYMAAPLSDDGNNILALLPELTPEVMPVPGYNLLAGLKEAQAMLLRSGFLSANILIITHQKPTSSDLSYLKKSATQFANIGIFTPLELTNNAIPNWLKSQNTEMVLRKDLRTMVWHDLGRWFLIPAGICLLIFFRRGYLEQLLA